MARALQDVLVGVVFAVVVGLASGREPAYFLMGLVLALSLAVMMFFGAYATQRPPTLEPRRYAVAGLVALALGYAFYVAMDSQPVWWAVGVILAGSFMSAATSVRDGHRAGRPTQD